MRHISVKDNRTCKIKVVCITKAAEIIGVARSTIYGWENNSKEETYRHWTLNFDVEVQKTKSTRH